jgi:hypothetical protein
VIIVRWPSKRTVIHPQRFPSAADSAARTFATAAVRLAAIKRERRLQAPTTMDKTPPVIYAVPQGQISSEVTGGAEGHVTAT